MLYQHNAHWHGLAAASAAVVSASAAVVVVEEDSLSINYHTNNPPGE
jgi:hypothetical protein